MAESYSFPLLFWRPESYPQVPVSSGDHIYVPLKFNFLSASYPTLTSALSTVAPPGFAEFIPRIESFISAEISKELRPYLALRLWFILMMFISIFWGLVFVVYYKEVFYIVLPSFIMCMLFWGVLTRLLMNQLAYTLLELDPVVTKRLQALQVSILGRAEISIKCGFGLAWLDVANNRYVPPAGPAAFGQ